MTDSTPRPAKSRSAGRKNQLSQAHLRFQRQAAASQQLAHTADPVQWWHDLLAREHQLQQQEALMTVCNIRWSHAYWTQLHDDSERLCREMAACRQQLEAR